MRENVFGGIALTGLTTTCFVLGVKTPELAAIGMILGIISIYVWCQVFHLIDNKPKDKLKIRLYKSKVTPNTDPFVLIIEKKGRSFWIHISKKEYQMLESYGL